jgi:hypothetical protein
VTDAAERPYAAFRLNLEQQQKRAKDLLKSAEAGDPAALQRLENTGTTGASELKLARATLHRTRVALRQLGPPEAPRRGDGTGACSA